MEENKNHFHWKNIVIVIMIGLLVFCVFKLFDMSEDISLLESRLASYQEQNQNQLSRLSSEINSIYYRVDEQLEKQASLISSVDYTLGELDTVTHCVPMILKVVPKTVTDDTELSVRIGDTTADFTRNGNEFTATVPVGLFIGTHQSPMLSIKTATETKTESLESVDVSNLYLYYHYLPVVSVITSPFCNFSNGKLEIDGALQISLSSESSVTISQTELVTERNGQEIERLNITSLIQGDSYYTDYNKTYYVTEEDELVIYVVSEDSLGYIHKSTVFHWKQLAIMESVTYKGGEIYDKNGNLLTE